MNIKFPILLLDIPLWNYEILFDLVWYDSKYISKDDFFYNNYLLQKRCLGSDGYIYIVIGRKEIKTLWNIIFRRKEYNICFEKSNEKWSFDKCKIYIVTKINTMENEEEENILLKSIEKATTIKELIEMKL